jgi:hypothetical protein
MQDYIKFDVPSHLAYHQLKKLVTKKLYQKTEVYYGYR